MTSAQKEYERFIEWLPTQATATEDVKRIAKLVYQNFEAIERTSAAQAQRSRALVPILIGQLAATTPDLPRIQGNDQAQNRPWTRLRQLTVGPFRGFQSPETFDLDKRIVLVYGPNGTGKTSLCEALEFALLGEVAEAEAKRIPEATYLQNVHAGRFSRPILTGTSLDAQEVPIGADRAGLQFCFIEKNRIDSFSRIAARTAGQRTELIASLFGLDGFTDFVRGFNNDINGQLSLLNPFQQRLALAQAHLQSSQTLLDSAEESSARIDQEESDLAARYEAGLSFAGLQQRLGTPEAPGRLQELNALIDAPPPVQSGVTVQGLVDARAQAIADLHVATDLREALANARSDVSFIALYEAVSGLEEEVRDRCPACDTPIEGPRSVVSNPFEKAQRGLSELAELAELQRRHSLATQEAMRSSETLLTKVRQAARTVTPGAREQFQFLHDLPPAPTDGWWGILDAPAGDGAPRWEAFIALAHQAEAADRTARTQAENRAVLAAERDRLNQINLQVAALKERRRDLNERLEGARRAIAEFQEGNQDLLAQVEQERERIAYHRRIGDAYNTFLALLREYRAALPGRLTADLSGAALALYNSFNRFDDASDQLAGLRLPATEDERIQVAYNSHPDVWVDALQMMSEGHIRCLGLSILIAKNIQAQCPVLIFDDAVNAIDNEHRLGIRDTLFDNPDFADKQILVTCHGEELIKDIEVIIGHRVANDQCVSYTFLPHTGDREIRVVNASTRNYVLEAQERFAAGRVRDALASARRAMESINDRAWSFLARNGHGELKLKLPRPRAPVDQHVLATAIKAALTRPAFVHERKDRLVAGYEAMLGEREWGVLNPGTHEQAGIEDFDRPTVQRVIENLAALDNVLTGN